MLVATFKEAHQASAIPPWSTCFPREVAVQSMTFSQRISCANQLKPQRIRLMAVLLSRLLQALVSHFAIKRTATSHYLRTNLANLTIVGQSTYTVRLSPAPVTHFSASTVNGPPMVQVVMVVASFYRHKTSTMVNATKSTVEPSRHNDKQSSPTQLTS